MCTCGTSYEMVSVTVHVFFFSPFTKRIAPVLFSPLLAFQWIFWYFVGCEPARARTNVSSIAHYDAYINATKGSRSNSVARTRIKAVGEAETASSANDGDTRGLPTTAREARPWLAKVGWEWEEKRGERQRTVRFVAVQANSHGRPNAWVASFHSDCFKGSVCITCIGGSQWRESEWTTLGTPRASSVCVCPGVQRARALTLRVGSPHLDGRYPRHPVGDELNLLPQLPC
jgi:hypothetical protein